MPDPALPIPWPTPLEGTVTLHRAYRDTLGRPLRGHVTITGTTSGGAVVAAPVTAEVVAGDLNVDVPPDTYTLAATLRTVDGNRVTVTDTITLES